MRGFSRSNFSQVKWGPLTVKFYGGEGINKTHSRSNRYDLAQRMSAVKDLTRVSLETKQNIDPAEVRGDASEPVNASHFRGGVADHTKAFSESFANVRLPEGYKHVGLSGMGANREWTTAVAVANNADPNKKANLFIATTPLAFDRARGAHQYESVPEVKENGEIVWVLESRSGKTAETLLVGEYAAQQGTFPPGLVYANGDLLKELGLKAQEMGAQVLGFSEDISIPGRYMRAKTEVLKAPMAVACGQEFYDRYWAASAEADGSLYPLGDSELQFSMARFLNTHLDTANPSGAHLIYMVANHPAGVAMNEAWIQLHNEGGGKDGYSVVAFQGKGLPDEAHYNIEVLFELARQQSALALFSFDTSTGDPATALKKSLNPKFAGLIPQMGIHALNMQNVYKWVDRSPAIVVEYDGITPEALAYLSVLGENTFFTHFLFNEINPCSNPEVRQVRIDGGPALVEAAKESRILTAGIE